MTRSRSLKAVPLLALALLLLLCASSVWAQTLSVVSEGTLTTSASDTTVECTLPGNTAAGDLVVLELSIGADRSFSSVTDPCSGGANTWASRTGTLVNSSKQMLVYSTTANSCTGPTTFVVNLGGGNSGSSECIAGAYNSSTGWPATASVKEADATQGSAGSGTAAATGTLTAGGAIRLIHSVLRLGNPRTITPDTGFTEIDAANRAFHVQRLITSSTFNETVDASWTTSTGWSILASAFAPNGGAATVPRRRAIKQ